MVTVGLVQADIHPHAVERNLRHYAEMLERELTKPVDLLVFPEMFACGFSASLREEACAWSAQCQDFLQQTAVKTNANVVASLPIVEQDKVYNRLFWYSPEGLLGQYDKKHLFFGDEQALCTAGQSRTIVSTLGHRFLPLICYDVRFPVWSRNRYENGCYAYDCLVYVANFPAPREEILQQLAAARAIENQAYAIVVNRVGADGNGFSHAGGSAVFDYEGRKVAAAAQNQEQILTVELDFEKLQSFRKRIPIAKQWD